MPYPYLAGIDLLGSTFFASDISLIRDVIHVLSALSFTELSKTVRELLD